MRNASSTLSSFDVIRKRQLLVFGDEKTCKRVATPLNESALDCKKSFASLPSLKVKSIQTISRNPQILVSTLFNGDGSRGDVSRFWGEGLLLEKGEIGDDMRIAYHASRNFSRFTK